MFVTTKPSQTKLDGFQVRDHCCNITMVRFRQKKHFVLAGKRSCSGKKNTCLGRHKHGWKLSRGLIKHIQWYHALMLKHSLELRSLASQSSYNPLHLLI